MTATDELRRMLDERGVKWEDDTPVPSMKPWKTSFTSFTGEEVSLECYGEPKWIMGTLVFHTPEQAVAATLGAGTCKLPETRIDHGSIEYNGTTSWRLCSACGAEVLADPANYCPNCGKRVME